MKLKQQVYMEQNILDYEFGQELYKKFYDKCADFHMIESHNKIKELQSRPNEDFCEMKSYVILGTRKTHKYTENKKVSDFIVPWTSSGCSAKCLYCYLVCNYNKCSYFRLFVNREQMMDKLLKTASKSLPSTVFEIGSNSDLVLENILTDNLPWVIEKFAKPEQGLITFPTKFSTVNPLLDLKHQGRVIFRMSVNPDKIIKEIEIGTSNLKARVEAINKMVEADYKVGILIAPIILVDDYKQQYKKMLEYMYDNLSGKAKKIIFFELIFMTYSYVHRKINHVAFPKAPELYSQEKMTGRGRGRYCYREDVRAEAKAFILELMKKYFKDNEIKYII